MFLSRCTKWNQLFLSRCTKWNLLLGKRNPIDTALNSSLNISPESRAHPRATHQGCTKCGDTSSLQRSWHRKKFWRKADNKKIKVQWWTFVTWLCLDWSRFKDVVVQKVIIIIIFQWDVVGVWRIEQGQNIWKQSWKWQSGKYYTTKQLYLNIMLQIFLRLLKQSMVRSE